MRTRQHVNPLGAYFAEFRGLAPRLAPGRPVEIEVGCADAQFLFERAVTNPAHTYLGFELRSHLVDDVNARALEAKLPVQAIFASANQHLRRLVGDGSVARVFVNFPDPWFKNRHRKRRMLDDRLARDLGRVLGPGGELFFQTDVWQVALAALDVLERQHDLIANQAGEWSFWKHGNPYGARSWREMHCAEVGLPIWRLLYRRRTPA